MACCGFETPLSLTESSPRCTIRGQDQTTNSTSYLRCVNADFTAALSFFTALPLTPSQGLLHVVVLRK